MPSTQPMTNREFYLFESFYMQTSFSFIHYIKQCAQTLHFLCYNFFLFLLEKKQKHNVLRRRCEIKTNYSSWCFAEFIGMVNK